MLSLKTIVRRRSINERSNYLNECGFVLDDVSEDSHRIEVVFIFVPQVCNVVAHSSAFNSRSLKE